MTDNDALVRELTNRFLSWKLPDDFNPDGGIIFCKIINPGTTREFINRPVGTNLFNAEQAKQMIEHLLEGLDFAALRSTPQPKPLDPPAQGATVREFVNELGNRIRITIEGPTSISENVLTPAEVDELGTALSRHTKKPTQDEVEALREENARLRGALRDASVSLWWAARQMKGNCNGGAVDAVNLAAEDASSVAALTEAAA